MLMGVDTMFGHVISRGQDNDYVPGHVYGVQSCSGDLLGVLSVHSAVGTPLGRLGGSIARTD